MSQRIALVTAAALAAFMAVVLGALGAYVLLGRATASPAAASPEASSFQAPAPQFGTGEGQPVATQVPRDFNTGNSGGSNNYPVSADQAGQIALNAAPGASLLATPTLVNLNGTVAYQVRLNMGLVYVDANSGQVLFSQATGGQRQPGFRRHNR